MSLSKVTCGRKHLFWLTAPEGDAIMAGEALGRKLRDYICSLMREAEKADFNWGEAVNPKPTLSDIHPPARLNLPKVPLPPYTVPPTED